MLLSLYDLMSCSPASTDPDFPPKALYTHIRIKRPKMKLRKIIFPIALGVFVVLLLLQSCYTVRVRSIEGVPMPDPNSTRTDHYRLMKVVEKDTVITIGVADKDFTMLLDCGTGGLHTLEYRNTLGGVLLSGITFGRKRRVRIKYVCMKPTN